jgi:hypothetical protein
VVLVAGGTVKYRQNTVMGIGRLGPGVGVVWSEALYRVDEALRLAMFRAPMPQAFSFSAQWASEVCLAD